MTTEGPDLSALRIDKSRRIFPDEPQRQKKRYWLIGGLFLFVLLIAAWWFLQSSPPEVQMVTATLQIPSQTDAVLNASGYVVAQRKASVASKGTGRLEYLGVVEGDRVSKDQIIARLDNSDIRAIVAEAEANLKLQQASLNVADKNYRRQKDLLAKGGTAAASVDAAESEFLRVQAAIELARAQLNGANVAMENTLIRAPFDGTVMTKNADVGEMVAPLAAGANSRAAVVTIADMTSLQVEADVSESNIEKIRPDMDCRITLDAYPDKPYPGFVAKIVPTADRSKATVMVKVGFKTYDARVLPEMSAKVAFMSNNAAQAFSEKQVLVIPQSALATRDGKEVVFQVVDNRAASVAVTPGRTFGTLVEITSGLSEGNRVIDNLTDQVNDGVTVSIK